MIKRLITWLYERYGKEPEYIPTLEDRKNYIQARFIRNEFTGAGFTGKPKPDYPQVNGKELSESAKKLLDQIYESAKQGGGNLKLIKSIFNPEVIK
jgi:hypothetical protein